MQYASPGSRGAVVDSLDVVILGATEIDTDFNVNVHTDSNGYIMGGSGGHSDTAAGAKLSMIIAPMFRARLPIVTDHVTCVSTPGKDIDVLVTAPINKKAMDAEGFGNTGHTEYLQKEFNAEDVLMFMVSESLKISVVTGHVPLKDVPTLVTEDKIVNKLRLMSESLRRDFGVVAPKIAVLGLNPHCGDGGLLGD